MALSDDAIIAMAAKNSQVGAEHQPILAWD